jgi:hypothetical protein
MKSDIPVTLAEDADHFAALAARRRSRERWRIAFLDKAKRTSVHRRRWFQISDIEPDPIARERLIGLWRASIYSGDLVLKGKSLHHRPARRFDQSQVLCLAATPLLEGYRLPPELARGEHFNGIVGDLWMSMPRWLEWLRQVGVAAPIWLTPNTSQDDSSVQLSKKLERAGCPSFDSKSVVRMIELINAGEARSVAHAAQIVTTEEGDNKVWLRGATTSSAKKRLEKRYKQFEKQFS